MGELDLILFTHFILELEYVNIHKFIIYNRILINFICVPLDHVCKVWLYLQR